jgi:hypothetical protein
LLLLRSLSDRRCLYRRALLLLRCALLDRLLSNLLLTSRTLLCRLNLHGILSLNNVSTTLLAILA